MDDYCDETYNGDETYDGEELINSDETYDGEELMMMVRIVGWNRSWHWKV